ncbi:hypothetical protein DV735_g600, partial [Chaetothyriales sp. CBS 134920]
MPAPFPSTFASAAASTNGDSSAKKDQAGAGDWSRNRPNGATHTFRRPSSNTVNTTSTTTSSAAPPPSTTAPSTSGLYIPPHLNSSHRSYRNGMATDTRYTKEQLLDVFQAQKDSGQLASRLADSFVGAWDPLSDTNGLSAPPSRTDRDQFPGPEVCWSYSSSPPPPLGLVDMAEEEKQLFVTSVNSPLKMPQNSKEGVGGASLAGATRKSSVSGFSATSTNLSRPGTRRRDTSDSFTANPPLSPAETKSFFQTSSTATPPPALLRRRTDFKEDDGPTSGQKEASKEEPAPSVSPSQTAPPAAPWATGSGPGSGSSAFGTIGSFASLNLSSTQDVPEKRPGFGSVRAGSRFKDLLAKTSTEDMASVAKEKSAFGGLEKLPEEDALGAQSRIQDIFRTRPARSETNPYDDGPARSASAALSASQDGRSSAQGGVDHPVFPYSTGRDFGTDGTTNPASGRYLATNEPLSPAHTNPFTSPQGLRHDEDDASASDPASQHVLSSFNPSRRNLFTAEPASRGFGALPGFGPWTSAGLSLGTPARDRNMAASAFGDPVFGAGPDLQSPGSGLGGSFFGGAGAAFGAHGRSSRLGAMFPVAMQEQMRGEPRADPLIQPFGSRPQSAQQDLAGRDPFDSSFVRGASAAAFGGLDEASARANEAAPGFVTPGIGGVQQQHTLRAQSANQRASTGSELDQLGQDGQLPAAQQRQMVMPDRMRWIYRDPQGNIQGPWSGLEMHDWFKAGFFTAELLVKKVEDADFEPLAQLVRRIGNSREPFLVPQIGVPHGPATSSSSNWPNPASSVAGSAQPPFASAFPSFGTTLTAEQQNALERRKQEEQYLMARQKEHLAQQQVYMRQQHQLQNGPHGLPSALQHHSSTQSLHSQPSFGSIASPNLGPFPASANAQIAAHHQPLAALSTSAGPLPPYGRDDDLPNFMERLNFNQRMNPAPAAGPLGGPADAGSGLGRNERLEEFNELRGQSEAAHSGPEPALPAPIRAPRTHEEARHKQPGPIGHQLGHQKSSPEQDQKASLTEQIQRQAEWKEQQPVQPPPASISPLPAPAAQRNRTHVAESLVPEPRSETQTPIEAPAASIAPWAQQQAESAKGPSLKEIQEAEARKAAQQEAVAAEARRIQAEQERLASTSIPPPAPGLPATSTWAQSPSPGPLANAWAKSSAKPAATTPTAKKTLAQIQKEEEARKQRQAAVIAASNAQTGVTSPASAAPGKRYAELASKAAQNSSSSNPGSAWTTVGSSGKAKLPPPNTIVATPQPAGSNRSVSSMTSTSAAKRPALTPNKSNVNLAVSSEKIKADEEFRRWLRGQLSKGLSPGIDVDIFMENLSSLPLEVGLIADAVYGASQTLDGRRVAEEFVRRKKLADKGLVEAVSNGNAADTTAKSQGGGWSEVAKKGPASEQRQESGRREEFKVVAGKKKGRR